VKSSGQSSTEKPTLSVRPSAWFGPYTLPKAIQSKPYDPQTITVSNGRTPFKFALYKEFDLQTLFDPQSSLPPGLAIDEATGIIAGTPTRGGTYSFAVKVTDADDKVGIGHFTMAVELNLDRYNAYFDGANLDSPAAVAGAVCRFDPDAKAPGGEPCFPLSLCEFLAYKSAQAYLGNDSTKPNDYLKGELQRCHPKEVTDHFAFFCSTIPLEIMDDEAAKAAAAAEPPRYNRAPGHWQEQQLKKLNKCRAGLDTQAYGFVFEGRTFIVCRGTTSVGDCRVDIDNGMTTDPVVENSWLDNIKYSVGLRGKKVNLTEEERILIGGPDPATYLKPARTIGFSAAWAAIRDQVENWLKTVPDEHKKEFVFSGHSLGGALAFVGAHEFSARHGRRIHAVVTFGAPCVGMLSEHTGDKADHHFVDDYRRLQGGELEKRTVRLESSGDAVPLLMQVKNFSHVGRAWEVEFPPLPSTTTLIRRKYFSGPLLSLARMLLRGGESTWSSIPRKGLGYAVFYGLPLANKVLAAHGAYDRYAMFLSTLAYRKIRRANIGELEQIAPKGDKTLAEKYALANKRLDEHLSLIYGPKEARRKSPRIILNPHKELSYMKKYYGHARTMYIF